MRKPLLALALLFAAVVSVAQDPWRLEANIGMDKYYGETVANGMLGLVSSEEPLKTASTVLAGCYDKFGRGEVSNFLAGFNFLNTVLAVDGTTVTKDNVSGYRQVLDMRNSVFEGNFKYGDKMRVKYQMVSLRQLPYCAVLVVDVTPLADFTLSVNNTQELPTGFKTPLFRYELTATDSRTNKASRLLSTDCASPTGKVRMACCSEFVFPTIAQLPEITSDKDSDSVSQHFTCRMKKGRDFRFLVVGATMSSAHHPDPINEVKRLTIACQYEGADRLLSRHKALWDDLWKSDIVVEGDPQSQQDIHGMMYHLYAFLREGSNMSISPMGLSGLGYNGHVFWDADTWMFPALLLLHPELARQMIDYRYDRIAVARRYAFEHGYKGAMFPWESADTGFEDTPVFALTGPFEHSVTGCVGFAAWQYYCVTGDKEWLREKGWTLLKETADFWISRVTLGEDGKYHVYNVVGADEWAENIDDDAFTNGVAKVNLLSATKAAKVLGLTPDPKWDEVAAKLNFISKNGVTMEHAAYNGENIKQADANLLAFPLKLITDSRRIISDLSYYQTRVPLRNTPAMTQAMFTLMYSRLGDADKAWHYFHDSFKPNRLPPFGVIAECKGGTNPYFVTGAGGVLQSVLMGFGGIDISYDGGGLSQVASVLPKKWKKLTITSVGIDRKTFVVKQK
jgi:protein-glucosylgalactosylhydroxylysine glucosidase